MQKLSFFKFHGAGNDFIMVDNRAGSIVLTPQQIAHICHRRLGVGADGLIMLDSCDCADFAMHYYNADGSDSMLCGNGSRCITAMANMLSVIDREGDFLASDGIHHAVVDAREDNRWQITIEIKDVDKVTDYADGCFVNTGAPHFVRRVNNIADYPIVKEGRAIRYDERFQGGTNANFIVPEGEGIRVRTYERGVEDETLSCGDICSNGPMAAMPYRYVHSVAILPSLMTNKKTLIAIFSFQVPSLGRSQEKSTFNERRRPNGRLLC